MSAEMNPGGSPAKVELVTTAYTVNGRCQDLTEYIRLIDLLNIPEVATLRLNDVQVRALRGARELIASDGPFLLEKQFVVFGRSLEAPQVEARRRATHRIDYVEKEKHRMLVFAPPFRILGDVYSAKNADVAVALPKLFRGFLAMTDVQVMLEGERRPFLEARFIVVNGPRVEMVCPSSGAAATSKAAEAEPVEEAEGQSEEEEPRPVDMASV